jgi:hypothetical protein
MKHTAWRVCDASAAGRPKELRVAPAQTPSPSSAISPAPVRHVGDGQLAGGLRVLGHRHVRMIDAYLAIWPPRSYVFAKVAGVTAWL